MGNAYDADTKTWNASAGRLLSSQELWFTIFITVFVLLPWVCVQKVEVEVEIVSRFHRLAHHIWKCISHIPATALGESGRAQVQGRHAAWSPGPHQPQRSDGVSCLWHDQVGRSPRNGQAPHRADTSASESMFADHHYMICGVQGDFTRSLVETIPTHIWTRRVRVRSRVRLYS